MSKDMLEDDLINKSLWYDYRYPTVGDLRAVALRRLPKFALDYLDGGSNEEEGLSHNREAFKKIKFQPTYIKNSKGSSVGINLFGKEYSSAMGVAPVGFQDMIWPRSSEIIIKSAVKANIPVIVSTVTTISLERAAQISEGEAWFQLYESNRIDITDGMMSRIKDAKYKTLVYTIDIPTVPYRPCDISNGLGIPPRVGLKMLSQAIRCPRWCFQTLKNGMPTFENVMPYLGKNPSHLDITKALLYKQKVTFELLKKFRDNWDGIFIIKGIMNIEDAKKAYEIGADGIIVSNHGARQLDCGLSPLEVISDISKAYEDKMQIFLDSGVRSGVDIAKALSLGAKAVFIGRPLMYGVATLGEVGATHTINILKLQLKQLLEQLRCDDVSHLKECLIRS